MGLSNGEGRLRGVLLGAGSIAPHHMLAWDAIDDVEIVAIADPVRSRALALADRHGISADHVYPDHVTALAAEHIDFVDIATVPALHRELVMYAADRGLSILCQKPFVDSLADARFLADYCADKGVRCVVNENWRWRPWYRRIKSLLDEGAVGMPHYAAVTCHRDLVLPNADGTHPDLLVRQPYTRDMPRLILLEWGIHLIDVMRYLFGPITSVDAGLRRVSPFVRGEDVARVQFRFNSGLEALLDISWASRTRPERRLVRGNVEPMVIEGDAGTLELDPMTDDSLFVTTVAGTRREAARGAMTPTEAYQVSYENCQRNFVRSLLAGGPTENEAADNAETLAATFAAYESAETGKPVNLS
ncbi:MAG: D-apiose dehydrogenase [Mycobacterium sp.]|nr:D-apiose dehydrogenase [Mycobacterium sp.]